MLDRSTFVGLAGELFAELGPRLALHLRGHGHGGRALAALAAALVAVARTAQGVLLVNDRVDVALSAGAHGAQLGRRSLPLRAARDVMGRDALLGYSAHERAEVEGAARDGADFVLLGTIYRSESHPGRRAAGPGLVRAAAGLLPVVAVGGVTPERVSEVAAAGAHGVAVLGGVWRAPDPVGAAAAYADAIATVSGGGA